MTAQGEIEVSLRAETVNVDILEKLKALLDAICPPRRPAVAGYMFITGEGGGFMPHTARATDPDQRVRVGFVDAEGNATGTDTTPTWTSSDENAVTVTPEADGDGTTAIVHYGAPGASLVRAVATQTNDQTGETYDVIVEDTITVETGEATGGSFTFEDITEPTPEPPPEETP